MAEKKVLLLLVAVCIGAAWGSVSVRPVRNTRDPIILDIEENESLRAIYERALKTEESSSKEDKGQRVRRNSNTNTAPYGFGTTVTLEDDHHTFALVHWSGQPKERIFILTRKRDSNSYSTESFLWISKNYGKSFENVTHLFDSNAVLEWYYVSSDADVLLFSDRINRKVYLTLDEGEHFTGYDVTFSPDRFVFQPSNIPDVDKFDNHVLGYDTGDNSLWVSPNAGATWDKLGDKVSRYAWRQLNSTYENETTVYFDQAINDTAAVLKYANQSGGYHPRTFDPDLGPFMVGTFALSHQYMFVQKNYSDTGSVKDATSPLWVSHYRMPFKSAMFPLDLQEKHYAMVDASEGQVLMGVYHDINNTHLYISEEAGMVYSLSLSNLISPPESEWIGSYPTFDVYVVEGILGTYIANIQSNNKKRGYTMISFDKGGEWKTVTPPIQDSQGQPITCNLPCSLHLHMYMDVSHGFQAILSQDSAPGVIMALGNIGTQLNIYSYSSIRLYMSENGGVTWRELYSGYKEFQLLDYGVFTAVVDKWKAAFYVMASCDEGYHWDNYTFTDNSEKINVVRLLTERGEKAQRATVFGYHQGVSLATFEWLVIDLDFTTLNLSQCTPADYYLWSPTDERPTQQCILGQHLVYERRLPDHCCYINSSYERPVSRSPCNCTDEDFECDIDFEHVDMSQACSPVDGYTYPPPPPEDCIEGSSYTYTSGYRKIAGDQCVNGIAQQYQALMAQCPVYAPAAMYVTLKASYVGVGTPVQFTLHQELGSVMVTKYVWDFGDSTSVNTTGLSNANVTNHSYSAPGVYHVSVIATNAGGQGEASTTITVLDEIIGVKVVGPQQVALGVPVAYSANITGKYSANFSAQLYKWKYNTYTYSGPVFTVTFTSTGSQVITLSVSNHISTDSGSLTVQVEEVPTALSITPKIPPGYGTPSGFLPSGVPFQFSINSSDSDYDSVSWLVTRVRDQNVIYDHTITDASGTSGSIKLPSADAYTVFALAHYIAGNLAVTARYIAEYRITDASIAILPLVYKIGTTVPANVTVKSYSGVFHVMALVDNGDEGEVVGSGVFTATPSSPVATLEVTVAHSGTHPITFTMFNNISSVSVMRDVAVADYGQFGYVRMVFDTAGISANYYEESWLSSFQTQISEHLQKSYSIDSAQLQVEVALENTTNVPINERASAENVVIVAHVYILPQDLNSDNIQAALEVSDKIKNTSSDTHITVGNDSVTLLFADSGPIQIEIIDNTVKGPSYLNLAVGVGVGVALLATIAGSILIVVIVYWRKKYRSLEVRYSRLRQGPVRFTFSAEGENLDDEDWKDDTEDPPDPSPLRTNIQGDTDNNTVEFQQFQSYPKYDD